MKRLLLAVLVFVFVSVLWAQHHVARTEPLTQTELKSLEDTRVAKVKAEQDFVNTRKSIAAAHGMVNDSAKGLIWVIEEATITQYERN